MRLTLFFSSIVFTLSVLTGCKSVVDPILDNAQVQISVGGTVFDENGKAISNATVEIAGRSQKTTEYGTFLFTKVLVPAKRFVIHVQATGYISTTRADVPTTDDVNRVRIGMHKEQPRPVSVIENDGLSYESGLFLKYPPYAFVLENGQRYVGFINLDAHLRLPNENKFYDFYPGDLRGMDSLLPCALGTQFGYVHVGAETLAHEKLRLDSGATITLNIPIDYDWLDKKDVTIPMWHYDKKQDLWIRSGRASLINNYYTATVNELGDWAFAEFETQAAKIHLTVVRNNSLETLSDVCVRVGDHNVLSNNTTKYVPDLQTRFQMKIDVPQNLNHGRVAMQTKYIGPLESNENRYLTLQLYSSTPLLKGKLANCDNQPIDGTIFCIDKSNVISFCTYNASFKTPSFNTSDMKIFAMSENGEVSDTIQVRNLSDDSTYDLGTLYVCNAEQHKDWIVDKNLGNDVSNACKFISYSSDASRIVAVFQNIVRVYSPKGEIIDSCIIDNNGCGHEFLCSYSMDVSGRRTLIPIARIGHSSNAYSVFDMTSHRELLVLDDIYDACISPDGQYVAYSRIKMVGNTIDTLDCCLQRISDGAIIWCHPLSKTPYYGPGIVFNSNRTFLCHTTQDLNVIDIANGSPIQIIPIPKNSGWGMRRAMNDNYYELDNFDQPTLSTHTVAFFDRRSFNLVGQTVVETWSNDCPMSQTLDKYMSYQTNGVCLLPVIRDIVSGSIEKRLPILPSYALQVGAVAPNARGAVVAYCDSYGNYHLRFFNW